eukprot:6183552-Pleurochrysis_carterae.AAC.1
MSQIVSTADTHASLVPLCGHACARSAVGSSTASLSSTPPSVSPQRLAFEALDCARCANGARAAVDLAALLLHHLHGARRPLWEGRQERGATGVRPWSSITFAHVRGRGPLCI